MKESLLEIFYNSPNMQVYQPFKQFMFRKRQKLVRSLRNVQKTRGRVKIYEYIIKGNVIESFLSFLNCNRTKKLRLKLTQKKTLIICIASLFHIFNNLLRDQRIGNLTMLSKEFAIIQSNLHCIKLQYCHTR